MMTDISSEHDPSDSVPSIRASDLSHSASLISLTRSKGDSPLYAGAPTDIDLPSQSDIIIVYVDQTFELVSKTQSPTVSWARPEWVKVQSVFYASIPLNVVH